MSVLQAELTWTGARFERDLEVEVEGGTIRRVGRAGPAPDRRLPRRALLPGFVNAHSHAFQRGLRGRVERFPEGTGDTWSWREAMVALAGRLDAQACFDLSRAAFAEMRAAGVTTVGEFHFLRHLTERDDYALDEVVLDAAREAGVRIVLLSAYVGRGDFGRPLAGAERRFRTAGPAAYWRQMDRLLHLCEGDRRWLGAAVHSVRAAEVEDMRLVYAESRRRGVVFHMQLEGPAREVTDCVRLHGRTPFELVLEHLDVGESFTAVHCTQSDAAALRRFRGRGGQVCLCPLSDANRGTGVPDAEGFGGVALGTDSNARISVLEEMRQLEYGQRQRLGRRGVLRDADGAVAPALLRAATEEGAHALGLPAGRIAPNCWADFVLVDLDAPALAGWTDDTLAECLVCGAGDGVLAGTCVAGEWEKARGAAPA